MKLEFQLEKAIPLMAGELIKIVLQQEIKMFIRLKKILLYMLAILKKKIQQQRLQQQLK